jgi:hypothetical protein
MPPVIVVMGLMGPKIMFVRMIDPGRVRMRLIVMIMGVMIM